MFSKSAELYDAIYSFKNYVAEAAKVVALVHAVHPGTRRLLDVGCGTGQHAWLLAAQHGLEVDGLDLDGALLEVARRKHPAGRFVEADMSDFALRERYDAILCLFGSIGYLVTLDRVSRALGCFRRHLASGGVVVVEPWFAPGVLEAGRVTRQVGEFAGLRVERISRTEIDGRISRLHFEYQIEGPEGVRRETEVHELGLFTHDEMLASFRAVGLSANFDPVGLDGRGLWVARVG